MARPPLAEVGRRQVPVDEVGVGVGRRVADEPGHLGRRRRQPPQVERQPADERPTVDRRRRIEPLGLQPGEDEPVLRAPRPRLVGDGGRLGRPDRLPRPVLAPPLVEVERLRRVGRAGRRRRRLGPRRAHLDPRDQALDLRRSEGAGRRHQHRPSLHPLHEGAPVRVARHHRGAAVAPREQPLPAVEPQPPERRLERRPVALEALLREQRPDLGLEELDLLGVRPRRLGAGVDAGSQSDGHAQERRVGSETHLGPHCTAGPTSTQAAGPGCSARQVLDRLVGPHGYGVTDGTVARKLYSP